MGDGSPAAEVIPPIYVTGSTYSSSMKGSDFITYDIVSCGPRCGKINVTQIPYSNVTDAYLFECQSTVHEVKSAVLQEQELGNRMALMVATSLSQGTDAFPLGDFGVVYNGYVAK